MIRTVVQTISVHLTVVNPVVETFVSSENGPYSQLSLYFWNLDIVALLNIVIMSLSKY